MKHIYLEDEQFEELQNALEIEKIDFLVDGEAELSQEEIKELLLLHKVAEEESLSHGEIARIEEIMLEHYSPESKKKKCEIYGYFTSNKEIATGFFDFSTDKEIREIKLACTNCKKGIYHFIIARNSFKECFEELDGQISDGFGENRDIEEVRFTFDILEENTNWLDFYKFYSYNLPKRTLEKKIKEETERK